MNAASSEEASGFARHRSEGASRHWRAWLAAESPGLDWLAAETCTSPARSPDGSTLAVISDRDGTPGSD